MAGEYARLLEWSKRGDRLKVSDSSSESGGRAWSISVSITDPVSYSAYARGKTIDDAAAKVIEQLETVGAKVE